MLLERALWALHYRRSPNPPPPPTPYPFSRINLHNFDEVCWLLTVGCLNSVKFIWSFCLSNIFQSTSFVPVILLRVNRLLLLLLSLLLLKSLLSQVLSSSRDEQLISSHCLLPKWRFFLTLVAVFPTGIPGGKDLRSNSHSRNSDEVMEKRSV